MTLDVAIIGFGQIGLIHARAYATLEDVRIVGAVEPDAARAAHARLLFPGVAVFPNLHSLLEHTRPNAACICSPARTHAAIAKDCASAGLHILCEKPLASNVQEAADMIAQCRDAGVTLGYGASYRFLPAVQKAFEIIRSGLIGEILLMQEQVVGGAGKAAQTELGASHYTPGEPGGGGLGLVDHGVHLIDLFRWFAASPVTRARGRGNRSGATLRSEYLTMEFASGAVGALLYEDGTFATTLPQEGIFSEAEGWTAEGPSAPGSWLREPGFISIHGTLGALKVYHYANQLYLFQSTGVRRVHLEGAPAPYHFAAQMAHFADCVKHGAAPLARGEDGLEALRILACAYETD